MFKKFLCLAAMLVLVAACDTTGDEGANGAGGNGSGMGGVGSARPGTQEDLVVNVGDRVFFSLDKADLSAESRSTLDRQAEWMHKYPSVNVVLEGHCDERGTREYNLALGERRAASAQSYLVAAGVSPNRITVVSYGKERPAVLGNNDSAWSQNRRAVTVVAQ